MKVKVPRRSSSADIRTQALMLRLIDEMIGDTLEVAPPHLLVAKPKFVLADLIAQCNSTAPSSDDMVAWESMTPAGLELC